MIFFTRKITELFGNLVCRIPARRAIVKVALLLAVTLQSFTTTELKAADIVVTGLVTDTANGETLPGVGVRLKGTSIGTSTDTQGKYSLSVPENATLVFTYIGYRTMEVEVGSRSVINVKLSVEDKSLSEVVVVGYGTQRKSAVTTAIGSVEGKDLAERGTVNPMKALQGQIAGVDIRSTSGRAGAANYNIQIRGQNSLAGGQPLFVVDGIIVDNLNYLNPQDISKMDVLKDAAASAIYGSRGSNGVVLVTTKIAAGISGAPVIAFDSYYGSRRVARMPDFMNGAEQWKLLLNGFITNGMINNTPFDATSPSRGNPEIMRRVNQNDYFDWKDVVLQNGNQQNHTITAMGATNDQNIRYVVGAGYQNEEGNFVQEGIKKYNFRASVDARISEKWLAGMNLNYSLSNLQRGSSTAVNNAFRQLSIYHPYDIKDGSLAFQPGQIWNPAQNNYTSYGTFVNPILELENSKNNTNAHNALGNLYLQFSPVSWIDIRSTFSPRASFSKNGLFNGSLTQARNGGLPDASISNRQSFAYIMDNIVTLNRTFKENHNFSFSGVYSIQNDEFESNASAVADLPFQSDWFNMGSTINRTSITSAYSKVSLLSYITRLNYSFKNKYLISIANRWDGTSKLATEHQWASFPSASIAWAISEEPFMKNINVISSAKIRLSGGEVGNNNNISAYETQALLSSPSLYDFGGTSASGYMTNRLINGGLTWERTREYTLGLDYELFKGRISGSVDVYDKLSKGLLMDRSIPVESGWTSIKDNVGSVSNKGFELSLRTLNVSTKAFSWSTSFTFARNKNAIEELLGKKVDLPANGWFIGRPINVFYNYVLDGVWQESERARALVYSQTPGQAKVKDLNNDNKISTPQDRTIIGQLDPKWTGGFNTRVAYKNFDLSGSLFARQGQTISSKFNQNFLRYDGLTNYVFQDGQYYMPDNPVTGAQASNFYPQPNNSGPYWRALMQNAPASYVKVQNIVLGYTVPTTVLQKAGIKSLRVYANVMDPFVFTDYKGFDPETDGADELNESGVATVTYQLGINLKF